MTVIKAPEPMRKPESVGMRLLHALMKLLISILPQASPDYNSCPWPVAYWLVKEDDNGRAEREIGFTAECQPVLFAHTERNMGAWTDPDRVLSPEEFEAQNDYSFTATWDALYAQTQQGTRSI